jgi:hypothetical protein
MATDGTTTARGSYGDGFIIGDAASRREARPARRFQETCCFQQSCSHVRPLNSSKLFFKIMLLVYSSSNHVHMHGRVFFKIMLLVVLYCLWEGAAYEPSTILGLKKS